MVFTFEFYVGMFWSAFYLANTVGPSLGGILVHFCGFRTATVAYFIFICFNLILDYFAMSVDDKIKKYELYMERKNSRLRDD